MYFTDLFVVIGVEWSIAYQDGRVMSDLTGVFVRFNYEGEDVARIDLAERDFNDISCTGVVSNIMLLYSVMPLPVG